MSDALWNIEAIDATGRSLGIADVVTFRETKQEGVVQFEAVWPKRDDRWMVRVNQIRIEGKMMDLETAVVISPGDVLKIRGLCNGRWAGRGGRLDG